MAQEKCCLMLWSSDNKKKKVAAEANKLRSCDKVISCWMQPLCRAEGMKLLEVYIECLEGCVKYSIIMDAAYRERKGIRSSALVLGGMGLFPLPHFPREGEKGKQCCHAVHGPCCSPVPYHCIEITGALEKTRVQKYDLACTFLLPVLTSGNKTVTKKESRGLPAVCLSPSPGPLTADDSHASFPIAPLPQCWIHGQIGAVWLDCCSRDRAGLCSVWGPLAIDWGRQWRVPCAPGRSSCLFLQSPCLWLGRTGC